MKAGSKVYVAGHTGLVGSALVRKLQQYDLQIITKTHLELDLTDANVVHAFFSYYQPEYVFVAAATVGGIAANNTYPVEFFEANMKIELNILSEAATCKSVKKLLFLGSSCIYPRLAPQPIKEEYLLTGALEPTNEAYAIAKIAGIILGKSYNRQYGTNYIFAMPTNLYGPNDKFHMIDSHVVPAMIKKFHLAKETKAPTVTLWGTGLPRREFLYVDDLAEALIFLMDNFDADPKKPEEALINVGTGRDCTIKELAYLIKDIVGYSGEIVWDTSMPDGTPQKLLDVSRLTKLGWTAKTDLDTGLRETYKWYQQPINPCSIIMGK